MIKKIILCSFVSIASLIGNNEIAHQVKTFKNETMMPELLKMARDMGRTAANPHNKSPYQVQKTIIRIAARTHAVISREASRKYRRLPAIRNTIMTQSTNAITTVMYHVNDGIENTISL